MGDTHTFTYRGKEMNWFMEDGVKYISINPNNPEDFNSYDRRASIQHFKDMFKKRVDDLLGPEDPKAKKAPKVKLYGLKKLHNGRTSYSIATSMEKLCAPFKYSIDCGDWTMTHSGYPKTAKQLEKALSYDPQHNASYWAMTNSYYAMTAEECQQILADKENKDVSFYE